MKELPKPAVTAALILGFALLLFVAVGIYNSSQNRSDAKQTLDELNIETRNPQPAGQNIAP